MGNPMAVPAPPPPEVDDPPPPSRLQKVSLRNRVTWLAAMCVAGAVALVSVGAFVTVRDSLYQQLDESLTERAVEAAEGPLVRTADLQQVPVAFFVATNFKINVLSADGTVFGPEERPPMSVLELSVAKGEAQRSLRTDKASNSRVVAVPTRNAALVMSTSLQPTQRTLAQLSVVLVVMGGAFGSVVLIILNEDKGVLTLVSGDRLGMPGNIRGGFPHEIFVVDIGPDGFNLFLTHAPVRQAQYDAFLLVLDAIGAVNRIFETAAQGALGAQVELAQQ